MYVCASQLFIYFKWQSVCVRLECAKNLILKFKNGLQQL